MKTEYFVRFGIDADSMSNTRLFERYTDAKKFMDDLYHDSGCGAYYCYEAKHGAKHVTRKILWTMLSCPSVFDVLKNEGFTRAEIIGTRKRR